MSYASAPQAPLRILLDVNHPSQAYVLRAIHQAMDARGHEIRVVARDKDVTLALLTAFGVPFRSLSRARSGRLGSAFELLERELRFYSVVRDFRPHVMMGRAFMPPEPHACSGADRSS